jgi:hypothetical protein
MKASPYDYTLFLDTDTYVCADCSELFSLLEQFDLAVSHAPGRRSPLKYGLSEAYPCPGVPRSFVELNTGVILFKKNTQIEKFFDDWLRLYTQQIESDLHPPSDQPAFRQVLYTSKLKWMTLTPEYNCRTNFPVFVCEEVKILHDRVSDFTSLVQKINETHRPRVLFSYQKLMPALKELCIAEHAEVLIQYRDDHDCLSEQIEKIVLKLNENHNLIRSRFWKFYDFWIRAKQHFIRS